MTEKFPRFNINITMKGAIFMSFLHFTRPIVFIKLLTWTHRKKRSCFEMWVWVFAWKKISISIKQIQKAFYVEDDSQSLYFFCQLCGGQTELFIWTWRSAATRLQNTRNKHQTFHLPQYNVQEHCVLSISAEMYWQLKEFLHPTGYVVQGWHVP